MHYLKETRLSDMDLVSSRAYIVIGVRSVWQVSWGLVWSGVQWIIKETQPKIHRNHLQYLGNGYLYIGKVLKPCIFLGTFIVKALQAFLRVSRNRYDSVRSK